MSDAYAVEDGPGSGTNLEFDGRERMDVVSVADLIEGTCDQVCNRFKALFNSVSPCPFNVW